MQQFQVLVSKLKLKKKKKKHYYFKLPKNIYLTCVGILNEAVGVNGGELASRQILLFFKHAL